MPTTYKDYNKREFASCKDDLGRPVDRTKVVSIPNEIVRNGIPYIITHNQVYSNINGTLKKVPYLPPDLSQYVKLGGK